MTGGPFCMTKTVTDPFFHAWRSYQKIVAANYMFHREIAQDLRQVLRSRFGGKTFSFLDLGCGDAAALAPVLEGLAIRRYKGVDLSQTALTLAAKNLAILPCAAELARGEFFAALAEEKSSFDVIYSSYAVHHLATEEKAEFFVRTAKCLADGGLLLLVDVTREEGESLEAYYQHYCGWLRSSWALDADIVEAVCHHLVHNDMPEPVSVLKAQARAAGLGKAWQAARYNWHRVLCFARE
jgi:SAM-dependent methyltransferase